MNAEQIMYYLLGEVINFGKSGPPEGKLNHLRASEWWRWTPVFLWLLIQKVW